MQGVFYALHGVLMQGKYSLEVVMGMFDVLAIYMTSIFSRCKHPVLGMYHCIDIRNSIFLSLIHVITCIDTLYDVPK